MADDTTAPVTAEGLRERVAATATCDVCDLPDPYNGQGDGIGSCYCPRCECGVADGSVFCTCPKDDGPACWAEAPDGGVRCGLDVDHEGEHHFNIWNPLETEDA